LGEFEEMPGRPGQLVQVFPERPGGISADISIGTPPSYTQDFIETFPQLNPRDNLRQRLFSFSSNDHIDPGVEMKDLAIIKGNVRPSPYRHRIGGETFHFPENFGSRGQIERKRGNPRQSGFMLMQSPFQAGERRTAELKILKMHFAPRLLQPGSQVQKPQRHGQAFDDRVRRIDKQNSH
jgi:hypothetical protein